MKKGLEIFLKILSIIAIPLGIIGAVLLIPFAIFGLITIFPIVIVDEIWHPEIYR